MKIAICFSGMIRAGLEASENIKLFLGDLYTDCDFFIHTWDIEGHNPLVNEDISNWEMNCPTQIIDRQKLEELHEIYKFKGGEFSNYSETEAEVNLELKKYINGHANDYPWWLPWFYSWHRSVLLKSEYENRNNFKYDYVIKMRPDVIFRPGITLASILEKHQSGSVGINQLFYNGNDISSDDILFVSSSDIADKISPWWIDRVTSGDYLDKETSSLGYFYKYMMKQGANVYTLNLNYLGNEHAISLLRQECAIFDAVLDYEKCAECNKLLYHIEFRKEDILHLKPLDIRSIDIKLKETRKHVPKIIEENKIKIAICFTGMIRTGIESAPSIKNYIGDLYQNVDFFMHTWDTSSSKKWHPDSVYSGNKQDMFNRDSRSLYIGLQAEYNNKIRNVKMENWRIWHISLNNQYMYFSPQWYSWYRSVNLMSEYEDLHNFKYDIVIKMRPDIIYPRKSKLIDDITHMSANPDAFYVIGYSTIRIDDVLFMASRDKMKLASKFFINTDPGPWTTNRLGEYLLKVGLKCKNLKNMLYTPLRPEGIQISLDEFHKHFNIDRDYFAPYNTKRLNKENIEVEEE